jgi:RNA polymerase primary sigma factor
VSPEDLLSAAEEQELARRAQIPAERPAAREELFVRNQRWALALARRYGPSGLPLEERQQAALLGLWAATGTYRPGGARFSTHCEPWIRVSLRRSLAREGLPLPLPLGVFGELSAARRRGEESFPSGSRLAAAAAALRPALPLEGTTLRERPLAEVLPDPQAVDPEGWALGQEREELEEALSLLTPRQRQIVRARYGLDGPARSQESLARELGLSRARIKQLEDRALRHLRLLVASERRYA